MSDDSNLTSLVWLAHRAGIDVQSELYNSALDAANGSDLAGARHHLLVLTGLFPSDGDAHLLLARVLMASALWSEAAAELCRAEACGADVPPKLLNTVASYAPEALESFRNARKIAEENAAARASLTPKARTTLRLVPTPTDADDAGDDAADDEAQPGLVEPEAAPGALAERDADLAATPDPAAAAGLDLPRRTQSPRDSARPILVGFAVATGLLVLSVALFLLRH
jgi:hypothetical protein